MQEQFAASQPIDMEMVQKAHATQKTYAAMDTALRRIFSAASGILSGEEQAKETARDIQVMVLKAFGMHQATDWSHAEYPGLEKLLRVGSIAEDIRDADADAKTGS